MQNFKKIVFYSSVLFNYLLTGVGSNIGHRAAENLANGLSGFGYQAVNAIMPAIYLGIGYCMVSKTIDLSCSTIQYLSPSEVDKLQNKEAAERLEILESRAKFKKCLLKNMQSPRGALGVPSDCEKLANAFAIISGSSEEVSKLIEIVDQFSSKQ